MFFAGAALCSGIFGQSIRQRYFSSRASSGAEKRFGLPSLTISHPPRSPATSSSRSAVSRSVAK